MEKPTSASNYFQTWGGGLHNYPKPRRENDQLTHQIPTIIPYGHWLHQLNLSGGTLLQPHTGRKSDQINMDVRHARPVRGRNYTRPPIVPLVIW